MEELARAVAAALEILDPYRRLMQETPGRSEVDAAKNARRPPNSGRAMPEPPLRRLSGMP